MTRQRNMMKITNSSMVELFWKVGKVFNNVLLKEGNLETDRLINNISSHLTNWFGPFFSTENIIIMQEFAIKCPQTTASQISSVIGWEYITELLVLNTPEKWIFYTRVVLLEQLTPIALKDKIAIKLYEHSQPLKLKFPDSPFFDIKIIPSKKNSIVEAYLSNILGKNFRQILEPNSRHKNRKPNSYNLSIVEHDLINITINHVIDFQKFQNLWLNSFVNLSFREIGTQIKEEMNKAQLKEVEKIDILNRLAEYFDFKYGPPFSKFHLLKIFKVANQSVDDFIQITSLLRWEHILILSFLTDKNEQFYYATLSATEDWSATYLKKQIKNGLYYIIAKKTNEDVDGIIESSLLTKNIYKNKYFIDFMSVNP
ncbi:DUF1016 N-terminal domain-containing protein [Mucilaginibacter terrae]|uniref:DUF1016 N-terminal domain-containing protein n=1 Tax=Mucilaginibacter terrae TaxID=1955052 RepID=UPI003641707E